MTFLIRALYTIPKVTSFFGYPYEQPFFVNGTLTLYQPTLASTTVFNSVPGLSLSGAEVMVRR